MEKHFLADLIDTKPAFKAEPRYSPDGDCIVYKMADEAVVAERVDELLTIYNSALDGRPIGFQIKDVHAIIKTCGLHGLTIEAQQDEDGVHSISLNMLLLAAHEEGPPSFERRLGYSKAMPLIPHPATIAASQIRLA